MTDALALPSRRHVAPVPALSLLPALTGPTRRLRLHAWIRWPLWDAILKERGSRHIFRQAEASLIVVNAHRVNHGEMPRLPPPGAKADFFFVEKNEPEEVLETLKTLIKTRFPEKFGFDPVNDVQVLTPMHRGLLGATSLNAELQALLNPQGASTAAGSSAPATR